MARILISLDFVSTARIGVASVRRPIQSHVTRPESVPELERPPARARALRSFAAAALVGLAGSAWMTWTAPAWSWEAFGMLAGFALAIAFLLRRAGTALFVIGLVAARHSAPGSGEFVTSLLCPATAALALAGIVVLCVLRVPLLRKQVPRSLVGY